MKVMKTCFSSCRAASLHQHAKIRHWCCPAFVTSGEPSGDVTGSVRFNKLWIVDLKKLHLKQRGLLNMRVLTKDLLHSSTDRHNTNFMFDSFTRLIGKRNNNNKTIQSGCDLASSGIWCEHKVNQDYFLVQCKAAGTFITGVKQLCKMVWCRTTIHYSMTEKIIQFF